MYKILLIHSITSFFIILVMWMLYKKNRDLITSVKKKLYQIPINQRKIESLLSIYNSIDIEIPLKRFNGFVCSPDFLNELLRKILIYKPQYILELGSGVSTIIIGKALKKNGFGKLISFEHLKSEYDKTNDEIELHKLKKFCTCIFSPLSKVKIDNKEYNWYSIDFKKIEFPIDMMIVDGPPIHSSEEKSRFPALPILKKYLSDNFIILVDDANRDDEKQILNSWKKLYPKIKINYINLERGLAVIK